MTALIGMCVTAVVLVQGNHPPDVRARDLATTNRPNQRGKLEAQNPARLAENSTNGQGRAHQEGGAWEEGRGCWSVTLSGAESAQIGSAEGQKQGFCLKSEGSGRELNLQKGHLE